MTARAAMAALAVLAGLACSAPNRAATDDATRGVALGATGDALADELPTTDGAIALDNLAQQLAQRPDPELLLLRAQLRSEPAALDRAIALVEQAPSAPLALARVRAAAHRFADAQIALDAAAQACPACRAIPAQRAALAIATGRAAEVLAALEADAHARPSFASHSALASAYTELGRFADADAQYAAALAALDELGAQLAALRASIPVPA